VHDYERAKKTYEMGYSLEPQNYEILNGLQNCLRRIGGFLDEGDRKEVANTYYEQARQHILSMINIANKSKDEKRYKLANLALAKLSWQRQQYREGIAKYEEISREFPDYITPKEELAAIKLEYGSKTNDAALLLDSVALYKSLYLSSGTEADKVFNGAGLAEAVSRLRAPAADDMRTADNAVSLSIVNNKSAKEDPYPLYATALLLRKQGKNKEAHDYISEAIRAETRRSANPYTFDYVRLREYEKLKESWDRERMGSKSSNYSVQRVASGDR
jgi:tetratricopeptide (TPR) repeat protein